MKTPCVQPAPTDRLTFSGAPIVFRFDCATPQVSPWGGANRSVDILTVVQFDFALLRVVGCTVMGGSLRHRSCSTGCRGRRRFGFLGNFRGRSACAICPANGAEQATGSLGGERKGVKGSEKER
jgi:hypothetical protein